MNQPCGGQQPDQPDYASGLEGLAPLQIDFNFHHTQSPFRFCTDRNENGIVCDANMLVYPQNGDFG